MSVCINALDGVQADLEGAVKIKLFKLLFREPGDYRLAHSGGDLLSQHYE